MRMRPVLGSIRTRSRNDFEASSYTLESLRLKFKDLVEVVKAIELRGDNDLSLTDKGAARKCWQQAIEEADRLSKGKYVWDVAALAELNQVNQRCRIKLDKNR